MKWRNSGFSRHYIKVKIEGSSLENLLNRCMKSGVKLQNIRYRSDTEVVLKVEKASLEALTQLVGNRYEMQVLQEGGYRFRMKRILKKKAFLAGIALFVGILFYQSLFIAEIQVSGYESLNEPQLRQTLQEAGFVEGCRKSINLEQVKLHMYEEYDTLAWIGIKYKGNLAQVTVAESAEPVNRQDVAKEAPCNIVADKAGYVSRIIPTEGIRAVENGTYVREGDVLISGLVPLQNVSYGTENEGVTETYVHAAGTAELKIPVRLYFYETASKTVKTETGRKSVSLAVNGKEVGLPWNYETCTVKSINLINMAKPVKLKIQIRYREEVKIQQEKRTEKAVKKQVINQIHQYAKENLPEKAQILNKSLNFTQEKNIITVGVTLETLQQIGIEEEIIVDKSNGKSEENGDQ